MTFCIAVLKKDCVVGTAAKRPCEALYGIAVQFYFRRLCGRRKAVRIPPREPRAHHDTGIRWHCWEPTVFPGEKRIQNGDILVFIVNIEKLYFIMNHFAIYTIKTKTNGFFMRFYSRTIVGSQLWVDI